MIFIFGVHSSDVDILHKLKSFFNNRGERLESRDYVVYRVTKLSDILDGIIPHFNTYPLQSTKLVSYNLFCAVAEIMRNNAHLTL